MVNNNGFRFGGVMAVCGLLFGSVMAAEFGGPYSPVVRAIKEEAGQFR